MVNRPANNTREQKCKITCYFYITLIREEWGDERGGLWPVEFYAEAYSLEYKKLSTSS